MQQAGVAASAIHRRTLEKKARTSPVAIASSRARRLKVPTIRFSGGISDRDRGHPDGNEMSTAVPLSSGSGAEGV
jgi:hypothetical protein